MNAGSAWKNIWKSWGKKLPLSSRYGFTRFPITRNPKLMNHLHPFLLKRRHISIIFSLLLKLHQLTEQSLQIFH